MLTVKKTINNVEEKCSDSQLSHGGGVAGAMNVNACSKQLITSMPFRQVHCSMVFQSGQ